MTALVRSVLAKRNPRNVPLDIYDDGGPPPFSDWFKPDPEGLPREEKESRDRAIKQYTQRLYDTNDDRRAAAREQYTEILAEIVRGIGETAHRIQSSGALHTSLDAAGWAKLGRDLASLFRDAAATVFIDHLLEHNLFLFEKTAKFSIGKKAGTHVTAEQLRGAFEERVVLIEQWIAARAAFEGRGEIRAARILRPVEWITSPEQGLGQVIKYAARVQAGIVAGSIPPTSRTRGPIFLRLGQIYFGMTDTLQILGDRDLRNAVEELLRAPIPTLRAHVKKAQTLAAKGEPKDVSRKLAREAAIREGDEPKENSFVRGILRYA